MDGGGLAKRLAFHSIVSSVSLSINRYEKTSRGVIGEVYCCVYSGADILFRGGPPQCSRVLITRGVDLPEPAGEGIRGPPTKRIPSFESTYESVKET